MEIIGNVGFCEKIG